MKKAQYINKQEMGGVNDLLDFGSQPQPKKIDDLLGFSNQAP